LLTGEQARLRELRLASLAADPEAFGSTYAGDAAQPSQWWERWATQSEEGTKQRTYLLVDDDDRWLGLSLVCLDENSSGLALLTAMWIAPEARGRRAAAFLCEACASWANERGCERLNLTVVVGNEAAQRAYEAAGFSIFEKKTWSRDGRTLEVLAMTRPL